MDAAADEREDGADGALGERERGRRGGRPSLASLPMAANVIRALLDQAFPDGEIDVEDRTGGGDHFQVTVVSPAFNGLPLIEQHKLVNAALAARSPTAPSTSFASERRERHEHCCRIRSSR